MHFKEKLILVSYFFVVQDSDEENPFGDDVGLGVKSMGDHL